MDHARVRILGSVEGKGQQGTKVSEAQLITGSPGTGTCTVQTQKDQGCDTAASSKIGLRADRWHRARFQVARWDGCVPFERVRGTTGRRFGDSETRRRKEENCCGVCLEKKVVNLGSDTFVWRE
jgi:hypothetical protein